MLLHDIIFLNKAGHLITSTLGHPGQNNLLRPISIHDSLIFIHLNYIIDQPLEEQACLVLYTYFEI